MHLDEHVVQESESGVGFYTSTDCCDYFKSIWSRFTHSPHVSAVLIFRPNDVQRRYHRVPCPRRRAREVFYCYFFSPYHPSPSFTQLSPLNPFPGLIQNLLFPYSTRIRVHGGRGTQWRTTTTGPARKHMCNLCGTRTNFVKKKKRDKPSSLYGTMIIFHPDPLAET